MRRSTFTDHSVTYGAVGATQAPDLLRYPPGGFRPASREARLGSGDERFRLAREGVLAWGVQRGAGMTPGDVRRPEGEPGDESDRIEAGMTATLSLRVGPFRTSTPVRVVYVVDEPDRAGFAYGTLPGHPLRGEESFVVEHRDDDSVWIVVRSFSRAAGAWRMVPPPRAARRPVPPHHALPAGAASRAGGLALVPGALPIADPAPADGILPAAAGAEADSRDFGVYLHVPFCRVRCGYCDFNTYTAEEIRGVRQSDYAGQASAEVAWAARVLEASGVAPRPASTVFLGGGTPTMLPAAQLAGMLAAVRDAWGLADGAEVTTEANPDSVDAAGLRELADAGVTRVSFGMQSAVPHVLATLERTHDPERVPVVVRWAREAGLDVSLDLIYGTPGESLDDWRESLDAALACEPDHVSAYSLIVEPGTRLARRIRRGELAPPDEDAQADMYELADARLGAAGFAWYEVSNWARDASHRSRHNLAYWRSQDWWGVGPGAHSHVGGVRWWNVRHPAAYAERVAAGVSPAAGRETLDEETRRVERIMLLLRIADGLPVAELAGAARREVAGLIADGLVAAQDAYRGRLVLTLRGRLLADAVVRRLT